MAQELVAVTRGPIAELRLNRPDKYNAMNVAMGEAMARGVAVLNEDPDVRVVKLTGTGKAFCAGGDFSMIESNASISPESNRRNMVRFYESFLSLCRLRMPSVAVIQGAAMGAGLCLALACDLRIASEDAKLGANFVRVGLHPGMGCTHFLPALIGPARAAELLLTGRRVSGKEAYELGLLSRVTAPEELQDEAQRLLESIASAAPIAVMQTKATLRAKLQAGLAQALEREAQNQAIDFATADLKEAVAAFRDSRKPKFSGR